ncbi:Vacuolar protein sorting-associated protein 35 [Kappamyces sp. JEL0680]|nr:Vacuolar protein sorting-associated protein 35 [Kappamyces sp. JEL0680]
MSLQLYLMGAKVADQTGQEELCYEFFVEAFTVYEESISESRAQSSAMIQVIATLHQTTVFGYENYETLITKCAVHCSRLLKRADQSRGVMLASHLFWTDSDIPRPDDKPGYKNAQRVLECLQKALKIADSVMDHAISIGLFVEILEQYLWYFERKNEAITANFINSLIELIHSNLANPVKSATLHVSLGGPLGAPPRPVQNYSKKIADAAAVHFINILKYIAHQQDEGRRSLTSVVPGIESGFEDGKGGRWGAIIAPDLAEILQLIHPPGNQ